MRAQFRIGSGLCWAGAWILAAAAPWVYLLAPSKVTWWVVIPVLFLPLIWLIDRRGEEFGSLMPGQGDTSAWGPPPTDGGAI